MGAEYVPTHRDIEPDPRFNSKLVTKFINCLMLDGKKSVATQVFYNALEIIEKRMTTSSLTRFSHSDWKT